MEATVTNKRLHIILRHPMQLCRRAGLFPVEGLDKETITKLRFNMSTVYALYHVATLVSQMTLACLSIYYFFKNDLRLDNLKNLLFYITGLISAFLLLKLAKNWPRLIRRASHIEQLVAEVQQDTSKGWKQDKIVYGVMLFALLEHILSITFQMKLVMHCNHDFKIDLNLIKNYFIRTTPVVFGITTYTEWKAILYEIANLQATFLWNITDAITMCTSLYLASYFQDLNKLIERQEKQNAVNWKEIRVFYSYLVELVNAVDENMCYLILMSFFTNLFFICIQLYYLTKVFDSWEHTLYYAFSFIFLFTRASVTSLLAANINTLAQQPLIVLQNVSPSEYTIDVQRFIRQIRYTTTALSGLFFYVTRGMIITVSYS
ncbi:gustatory receptor for sugar taste 64f-like [Vanessa atalanta]|uniref:gustatory receptor for sugar taste 64f-like n=1 Tax=Vanessa atalanta TaxID=42275 RepID=UPI001FCD479D|nr:gustatory receptor for sugar taste 64f-like [Vanessa atalanta]